MERNNDVGPDFPYNCSWNFNSSRVLHYSLCQRPEVEAHRSRN